MFSKRTQWNRTANRLTAARSAKREADVPIFDLTESNPTRVGLDYPQDLLRELADPEGLVYDPDTLEPALGNGGGFSSTGSLEE